MCIRDRFKTRNIHCQSKATSYKVMIKPVITYDSETCILNKRANNPVNPVDINHQGQGLMEADDYKG